MNTSSLISNPELMVLAALIIIVGIVLYFRKHPAQVAKLEDETKNWLQGELSGLRAELTKVRQQGSSSAAVDPGKVATDAAAALPKPNESADTASQAAAAAVQNAASQAAADAAASIARHASTVATPAPVTLAPNLAARPTYDPSGPHYGTDIALAPAVQNFQSPGQVIAFAGVGDGTPCHLVVMGVSGNYFGKSGVPADPSQPPSLTVKVVASDGTPLTQLVVPNGQGTRTSADTPSFTVTGPYTAFVSNDGSGAYGVQKMMP